MNKWQAARVKLKALSESDSNKDAPVNEDAEEQQSNDWEIQQNGSDIYTGRSAGWSSKAASQVARGLQHKANRSMIYRHGCIIDPRTSRFFKIWSLVTGLALTFVTLVTPVEVGIMINDGCGRYGTLWWVNRVVDCLFLVDMFLQFFIMIRNHASKGGWTSVHRKIARAYLCGWFVPDLVSVGSVIFDLHPSFCPPDGAKGSSFPSARALRLFRLFRLTKLGRLLRGSKGFKSMIDKLALRSGTQALFEITVVVGVITHWLACFLVLQVTLANKPDPLDSWLGRFGYCWISSEHPSEHSLPGAVEAGETQCLPLVQLYLRTLNWAILLVTGMDHVPPMGPAKPYCYVVRDGYTNPNFRTDLAALEEQDCAAELDDIELNFNTAIILFTAMMWTLVTAKIVDVVASTDPGDHEFKQNLDDLNNFLEYHGIKDTSVNGLPSLGRRLREYMQETSHLRRMETRSHVQSLLSPELQAEVAITINSHWHNQIPFFKSAAHGFLVRVGLSMTARVFPPAEVIAPTCLYVINTGIVHINRALKMHGNVFGADCLLRSQFLSRHTARAMCYTEAYCISAESMYEFAAMYPKTNYVMKKWVAFTALSYFLRANLYEHRRKQRVAARLTSRCSPGSPGKGGPGKASWFNRKKCSLITTASAQNLLEKIKGHQIGTGASKGGGPVAHVQHGDGRPDGSFSMASGDGLAACGALHDGPCGDRNSSVAGPSVQSIAEELRELKNLIKSALPGLQHSSGHRIPSTHGISLDEDVLSRTSSCGHEISDGGTTLVRVRTRKRLPKTPWKTQE